MNKLLGFLLISAVIISCGKDNEVSNDFSAAAFINAAPGAAPSLNLYIDTFLQTSIGFKASSGYLSFGSGNSNIQLKHSGDLRTFIDLSTQGLFTNTAQTFIVYDTISTDNPTLKSIRLNDTLTLAPAGFIKVRFIPLAPLAPAMDVTFVRTSVTPNDSITFRNRSYIGTSPDILSLSAFTTIPLGAYTVKLKEAGTQNLVGPSTNFSIANLAGVAGITGISTIYVTGGVQNLPLSLGLFRHYP